MQNIKLGFIGFGNMAQAMVKGLLLKEVLPADQIYACAKNWEKLERTTGSFGIHPCHDAREVAEQADLVIVAVKPYLVKEVLEPVRDVLKEKAIVSVAAGLLFEQYEEILGTGYHHLSTQPNTPVSVGEGVFVCENRHSLTAEQFETFQNVFSNISLVQLVDTRQFGIAGVIGGCGPAYGAMFIEALADAAVLYGLPRELSYALASQMLAGTGKMQVEAKTHPGAMKDAVCSPGGITIKGVAELERKGFRGAVIDAIDAVMRK